jgi:hypothetical protein
MAYLVHNERAKLLANALDRSSTACFTVGVFVPTAAVMLGQTIPPLDVLFATMGCWLFAGSILHIEARRAIGTLRE